MKQNSLYDMMLDLMKENPRARERSNRRKVIAHLIRKKYELRSDEWDRLTIKVDTFEETLSDAIALDRYHRDIGLKHEELRGLDYDGDDGAKKSKKTMEQEKMMELGYEPGYKS